MLALIYLALAIYLGDLLCRRFYRFVSVAHRWAAAVITGLLISSWFTYLAGLLFTRATQPLLWGNACSLLQQPPCYVGPYGNRGLQSTVRTSLIIVLTRSYTCHGLRVQ